MQFREVTTLTALNVRISLHGRMISVSHGHRTLHSREQRRKGGRRFRLPSAKVKQLTDLALTAAAYVALTGSTSGYPEQDIDT